MEFRLLGPLEVVADGQPLALGGGKQRALLARLLLERGRIVSVDALLRDLWDGAPPDSATKMIQIYVSRLRKALPEGVLETRAPGYRLVAPAGSLDLDRFERLWSAGRGALREGRRADAAQALHEALELWRGTPLAEFSVEPFASLESARLEELRLGALEDRFAADLELGRHGELVAELNAVVARHPLRERLRGQLLLALYRSGRQADALASYRAYHALLDADLGLEPSTELRELERRILVQDPALDPGPVSAARAGPVVAQSEVRHARSGDVGIAYQVVGDGEVDLVLVHGWVCTFHPGWEDASIARFYRRLASLGRLILFDKRGTGLSDRIAPDRLPDLETRVDDVRAVMDAARSRRAVLIGISEGGPMSMLFAATYPARTAALVLLGTFPRAMWAPDYELGQSKSELDSRLGVVDSDDWLRSTTEEWLGRVAPAVLSDPERAAWYRSYVMRGASPASARALRLMNAGIDVRHVLPAVGVPTLVAHRSREPYAAASKYVGERIAGARVVELPGDEHLPWEGDQDSLLDAIERFLARLDGEDVCERALVTLLVLEAPPASPIVGAQLARFDGREVDVGGDRVLAVFDGPVRAVRCARSIVRSLGSGVRAGVHSGEVEFAGDRVRGAAVAAAAGAAAAAGRGEVLVSHAVRDLAAGSGLEFEDRGVHVLDGVPGEWRLLAAREAVTAPAPPAL